MRKPKCRDGRRNNQPPKRTQFKPGQCGNSKGRPKKVITFYDRVMTELKQLTTYVENGERISATMETMLAKQLVRLALKGNMKALEQVLTAMDADRRKARKAAEVRVPEEYSMENLSKLSADELAKVYAQTLKADEWNERNFRKKDEDEDED